MSNILSWMMDFDLSYPLGYKLRDYYFDYWFRIHSFPCSKRSPDSSEEEEQMVGRHAEVAAAVLAPPSHVFYGICTDIAKETGSFKDSYKSEIKGVGKVRHIGTYPVAKPFDEEGEVDFWLGLIEEGSQSVSMVLADYINIYYSSNRAFDFMTIYSEMSHACYSPYEGGADIVVKDKVLLKKMKQRFANYMSEHPAGL